LLKRRSSCRRWFSPLIRKQVNWSLHAKAVAKEARKRLGAIRRIAHMLDDRAKMMAYKAFVRSKIGYGNLIYWGAAEGYLE